MRAAALSVFEAAEDAPDRLALIDETGRAWTWREIAGAAEAIDTPSGETVVFDAGASVRSVATILACLARRVPFVPLHPALTASERAPLAARAAHVPAGIAAVVFTSGSTGTPKGVMLTEAALIAAARAHAANMPLAEDDRWLVCLPLAHVGGLMIVVRSLLARSAMVLAPRFEPADIVRHGITRLSLVPTQLHRWLRFPPPSGRGQGVGAFPSLPSLRSVLLGGAPASTELLVRARECGLPILATYGMTEMGSQISTWRPGANDTGCGRPLPGVDVRIAPDGHIHVRGAMRFAGYLGMEGTHPLPPPGGRGELEDWFDTGDLGRLDERGNLHVLGRADDLIVTGGENVHPAEIEHVLETCPGVAEAFVFGAPDAEWGQRVCAAIVGTPADEAILSFTAERLAPHKRPRRIVRVASLPRTRGGKLDRTAARTALVSAG